jgi:FKBP-type peptidyl-prolyl cis-trans isomerase 2
MNLVPALACLLLLSGCLGYPPGSVRPGDLVALHYTATDAAGEVLAEEATATATVGQPSLLGPAVDRALAGHKANDTFTVDSNEPAAYGGTQAVPAELGTSPMESVVPRSAFQAQLGPPVLGREFRASALYNATVVAFDGGNVTYRLKVGEGQEIPVPALGLKVVHHIAGDDLVRRLAPLPGATFGIDPSPTGQTPLGLPPGSYRTRAVQGDELVFDYSPVAHMLFGKPIHFDIKIVAVRPGAAVTGPPGEYGHRSSPQLLGDASGLLNATFAR